MDNKVNKDREAFSCFLIMEKNNENFFNLEPQTIKHIGKLSDIELEGVLACQNIWHNRSPFEHWHIFLHTACSLNQRHADFVYTKEVSVAEICYAYLIMRLIDSETMFSDEVINFIAVHLHNEGFIQSPHFYDLRLDKEETLSNMTVQKALEKINVNSVHSIESEKMEVEKVKRINDYVLTRLEKIKIETNQAGINIEGLLNATNSK